MSSLQSFVRRLQKKKVVNPDKYKVRYSDPITAAQSLARNGIVIIDHPYSTSHSWSHTELCSAAHLSEDASSYVHSANIFDLARQKHSLRLQRGIHDTIDRGMLDVFNPITNGLPHLESTLTAHEDIFVPILSRLAEIQNCSLAFSHTNLYLYTNVITPRCLHIDSLSKQIKVFLTLSPINKLSQGPFCYVPKTNNMKLLHLFTLLINNIFGSDLGNYPKTDSTLVNSNQALPLLVPSFTLFICMQNGVHGDLPCMTNFSRASFVWNYSLK
jgi:hypothetical protein